MTKPGRVLGIDPGDARHGLAISDADRRVAVPLGTVHTGPPGDLKAIARIVAENDATLVVVGHPLSMTGARGSRALAAEEFARALESVLSVPVVLHDERLTTVEAERALRSAGADSRRIRRAVDRSAAAVMLQSWLDSGAGGSGGKPARG